MAAYAAFVVYGSLVPLEFRAVPLDEAWQAFLRTPYLDLDVGSRADWIANGVLYAPLGALACLAFSAGRPGVLAATLALGCAWALALAVEFTQLFFPPRTVSQNDLIAEAIGSTLGVLLAFPAARWWERWRALAGTGLSRLTAYALPAYALAYVLYCFFPFDVLVSAAEWRGKLDSRMWGALVAWPEGASWLRILLQACAEAVLAVPIGMLVARSRGAGPAGAAAWGGLLGLVVEVGQLAIASGVSQGLSVLTRAAGAAAGAWAWALWHEQGLERARRWLDLRVPLLFAPWLVLLLASNGWGLHGWGGLERAAVSWQGLRWQPFYYHYYTTEAVALASLGSVIFMYAPLAVMAWARRSAPTTAALLAVLLAAMVEASKLLLTTIRPDPTNVLIAGASVWLLVRLLSGPARRRGSRRRHGPLVSTSTSAPPPAAMPGGETAGVAARAAVAVESVAARASAGAPAASGWLTRGRWREAGLWLLPLPLVAWGLLALPGAAGWLAAAVVTAATVLTWRFPAAPLALLPAALPVLDLGPWTGRLLVDEFDLLLVACVAVAMFRLPGAGPGGRAAARGAVPPALVLFGLSLLVGTTIGVGRAWGFDANSAWHPYGVLNGVRIAKGAVLAGLFAMLAVRAAGHGVRPGAWIVGGVAAGLACTVAVVLWERLAFVGNPFDFAAPYRVTGLISAMHKGGAYIECFIAVASAVVVAGLMQLRGRLLQWPAVLLLATASWAMMVTYSRNGYAALGFVFGGALVIGLALWRRRPVVGAGLVAALLLAAAAAWPVLSGSYAQERLATTRQDLQTRVAHWQDALALRDDGLATTLFGMGVGRFPEAHFWNSREPRAAAFGLEQEQGNQFLRLGAGAPVYIDQVVEVPAGQTLQLGLNLRARDAGPSMTVLVCRKWLLTSMDCQSVQLKGPRMNGRHWQMHYAELPALPAAGTALGTTVPVKLSLMSPGVQGAAVDIDNVWLAAPQGRENLLANGGFETGMQQWFFGTDLDPPWHIHSLPVALLFDQGWWGLATGAVMVLVALGFGLRGVARGDLSSLAATLGLGAFLVSGTLNTLIDEPRFLALWLLLAWWCCWSGAHTARGSAFAHDR